MQSGIFVAASGTYISNNSSHANMYSMTPLFLKKRLLNVYISLKIRLFISKIFIQWYDNIYHRVKVYWLKGFATEASCKHVIVFSTYIEYRFQHVLHASFLNYFCLDKLKHSFRMQLCGCWCSIKKDKCKILC